MQITLYSVISAAFFSGIVILFFSLLFHKLGRVHFYDIWGMLIIYFFCFFRMLFPIEFPFTIELNLSFLNFIFAFLVQKQFSIFGHSFYVCSAAAFLWGFVAFIKLSFTLKNYILTCRNYDRYTQPPFSEPADLDYPYPVIYSSLVSSPFSYSILNPKIVIPSDTFSGRETKLIIAHECAHIEQRDSLIKLLAFILCDIYWWNPFVYLFKKDMICALEIRCDQTVTDTMSKEDASEYLSLILDIFKSYDASSYGIKRRFSSVVIRKTTKGSHIEKPIAIAVSLLLFILSYCFIPQSYYNIPLTEIETDSETYKVINDNFILYRDGRYFLMLYNGDSIELTKEQAEDMQNDGYEIISQ